MDKAKKYDIAYLKMAETWGKLSYCKRRQVGAIIVKNRMIISDGYNGTPTGFENVCEDEENYTKWYVLHAEANAILKVASSTQVIVKVTTSPTPFSPSPLSVTLGDPKIWTFLEFNIRRQSFTSF